MQARMKQFGRLVRDRLIPPPPPPQRILFDHLPKCAGTTITSYISSHYPRQDIFRIDGSKSRESVQLFRSMDVDTRHRFRFIAGHLANELIDLVHPDTIAVTVFREPVDRIISHYFYVKRTKGHYLHAALVDQAMSLEDYATSGLSSELRNWYTTHFSGLSIEEAEADPEGSVGQAAEVIAESYQIVGFQDDIGDFAAKLQRAGRLSKPFDGGFQNRTGDRPATENFPEKTLRLVSAANALDVALFALLQRTHQSN